jgi:hypothetical protein
LRDDEVHRVLRLCTGTWRKWCGNLASLDVTNRAANDAAPAQDRALRPVSVAAERNGTPTPEACTNRGSEALTRAAALLASRPSDEAATTARRVGYPHQATAFAVATLPRSR